MVAYAVAQISDLHIVPAGLRLNGGIDTAGFTRAAVEHLNRFAPAPDVVLATGDLVDGGGVVDYENLRDLIAPLRIPLWLLPGNHDDRSALREVFAGRPELGDDGPVRFVIDGPLRVVALDSSRLGEASGSLDADQLAWLDATLAAAPSTPTIVALHHPPFVTGISHMDAMGLDEAAARGLGAIVERHPQIERVQAGHLHRSILCRWHGTIAATAPSVAHAVALDLNDAPAAWSLEPPAFLLHRWTPETGLVTHLVPIGDYPVTPYG